MIRPWVSPEAYWVVKVHQDFQGFHYYERIGLDPMTRRRTPTIPPTSSPPGSPTSGTRRRSIPDYDTLPLEHFEPMVREVFSRPPRRG